MDQESIVITVGDVNRPPVLNHIGDRYVLEGHHLSITVVASDPDQGDTLSIHCLAAGLAGASCTDHGDGTAELAWTPGLDDQGVHQVTVEVTDDGSPQGRDEESFNITVGNVNRAPSLSAIGDHSVTVGDLLQIPLSASDPDGDLLGFYANGLSMDASLIDNGDGTGSLIWAPSGDSVGLHEVEVVVEDTGLPAPEHDSEVVRIEVFDAPNEPVDIGAIPNQTVTENQPLVVTVTASDPEGDPIRFSLVSAPTGASLVDFGNGTAEVHWKPSCGSVGSRQFRVRATDGSSPVEAAFTVTVKADDALGYIHPSYQLVSSQWSGWYYIYTYRATFVSQSGCPISRVTANATLEGPYHSMVDSRVTFSNVPAMGKQSSGADTFSVRRYLFRSYSPEAIHWQVGR
jgi:hypothetical protein